MASLRLVEVVNDGTLDAGEEGEVLGWGVRFPSGQVVLDWRLEAFNQDERLENPHLSIYGSLEDLEEAIGGAVIALHSREPTPFSGRYPQGTHPENQVSEGRDSGKPKNSGDFER